MLRTDRDDAASWPETDTAGVDVPRGAPTTAPMAPDDLDGQETEPIAAVAVRETQGRRWAARLGVVDILLALLAATLIGVDLFVGLGGLRITGNLNGTTGTALASPTHITTTPAPTTHPQPTATLAPIPSGVIHFGGGGDTNATQQCNGSAPLASLNISIFNTQSTVAVDWWVDVQGNTPDGKALWAAANRPYGTLPAGQSDSFTLTPDPSLCGELTGPSPVTYKAVVNYGGVGAFNITDVITPDTTIASPTPTSPLPPKP